MACEIIEEHALSHTPIVISRHAGGFARDKIMGIQCHDIGVALDVVTGHSNAIGLADNMKDHPNVHKILTNSEKSKHLETAVINLHGYSIDSVHFRNETCTDTRIPVVEKGIPEEDAFRRVITINSLLYKLISNETEDLAGRGIHDIQNMIIDAPLYPEITLFDEPLRTSRNFRFKCRLGFIISDRIYEALEDRRLGACFGVKRNGTVIMKVLQHESGETGPIELVYNNLVFSVYKPAISSEIDGNKILEYSTGLKDALATLSCRKCFENIIKKTADYPLLSFI